MPGGLPSLRWSAEPKRRRIVKVAGVKKASRLNASASSVSQPTPELTSGRSDAPLLRPSIRGDRGVALSSASSATTRELALDGLLTAMSAPSAVSSQESLIKTWTSFHVAWFGPSVEVLPLVPQRCSLFALCFVRVDTCLWRTTFQRSRIYTLRKVLAGRCVLREHSGSRRGPCVGALDRLGSRQLLISKQPLRY